MSRGPVRALLLAGLAAALVACGPNALPRQSGEPPRQVAESAGDAAEPATAAPPSAPTAPLAQVPVAQVPVAQVVGGAADVAGRLLVVQQGDLWLWEKGSARALAVGYTWRQPRWAPDGTRFTYVYRGNSFSDIFVTDVENRAPSRLTNSQSRILDDNDWNFHPTWSPDGRQIAFTSDASTGSPTLWLMNADGTNRRPLPTGIASLESVDHISWAPDGGSLAIAFFTDRGPSQVARLPLPTGGAANGRPAATVLTAAAVLTGAAVLTSLPGGAMDPAWSPDGRWLAYAARDGRGVDVYVMRPDGSGATRLTNAGARMARAPEWSPDGRSLAYLSAESGTFEVWVLDLQEGGQSGGLTARGAPRQVTKDLGLDAPSGITWAR